MLSLRNNKTAYIVTKWFFCGSNNIPREVSLILCVTRNLRNQRSRDQNVCLASSLLGPGLTQRTEQKRWRRLALDLGDNADKNVAEVCSVRVEKSRVVS